MISINRKNKKNNKRSSSFTVLILFGIIIFSNLIIIITNQTKTVNYGIIVESLHKKHITKVTTTTITKNPTIMVALESKITLKKIKPLIIPEKIILSNNIM